MPTEYIHFTTEQKEAARQTDIVALLQSRGERLKRSGKEYVWRDGSEKVKIRENLWFHQYERIGGDAVDFVRRFYNMDFPQAVNFLLGNNGGIIQRAEPVKREPPKPFELPPQNENMRRVYAYLLNRRGIDREVLSAFVHKGMIYESADYLADRTNENNECWPAIPTIATDLKLSASTVRRGIRDLKKAGLLETEQRYRKKGGKSSLLFRLKAE